MSHEKKHIYSRRKFIGTSSCAAMGCSTFFSTFFGLKKASAMAASSPLPTGDYKALVCILLAGGNDSFNMLVPMGSSASDSQYTEYQTVRSELALPWGDILPLNGTTSNGKSLGLHPSMPELQSLFNSNKLAFLPNVGTLVHPTSKSQYYNETIDLPLGLYSHADQIQQWQTGIADQRSGLGWGGRMSDIMQYLNTNQQVSMNISMNGNNIFQSGSGTTSYAVNPDDGIGKTIMGYGNTDDDWDMIRTQAIDSLMDQQYLNLFEKTYANIIKNSQDASSLFNNAISGTTPLNTSFSDNELSNALRSVASTIAARSALGACRQTFFVVYDGWDHHDEVLNNQLYMLGVVSKAMQEFYDATTELGIADKVTTFTVSDFARTLTSNGYGTDHAWGGNVMAMGDSVAGGQIYGDYPDLYNDNPFDVGDGRGVLIPQTSTDEYFAELAMWFGVSVSDLPMVLPNIGNFYSPSTSTPPIGFMV